jgi:hypothetical protein
MPAYNTGYIDASITDYNIGYVDYCIAAYNTGYVDRFSMPYYWLLD